MIRLSAVGVDQGVDTTAFQSRLITLEGIAGESHHLAGAGHIAEFGSQLQQAKLVFDDVLLKTIHVVTPWRLRALFDKDSHLYQTG